MMPLSVEETMPSPYFRRYVPDPKQSGREWRQWLKRQDNKPVGWRKFDPLTIHKIRTASGKLIEIAAEFKISVSYCSKIRRGLKRVSA